MKMKNILLPKNISTCCNSIFYVLLSLYIKEQPSFLKRCLDSLLSQTLQPNEIVLVKDGPLTSELDAVVSDFAKHCASLKVLALPQNQGLGRALNEGLKYCSYDLVARMDTDDIAKPDRFEKQVRIFNEHPEVDICSAWMEEFFNSPQNSVSIKKLPEIHADIVLYAQSRNPINHPVAMFRKKAVIAAGGYQHFPLFEDYYLWVRMLKNGAKFYNIQESLLYFRISPDMFMRRGGWRYAIDEFRFQKTMLDMGMVSQGRFLRNVLTRFPVRIAPNKIRSWLYQKALRK